MQLLDSFECHYNLLVSYMPMLNMYAYVSFLAASLFVLKSPPITSVSNSKTPLQNSFNPASISPLDG